MLHAAITVIDTSRPNGYSVEYSAYKDAKTNPERGRSIDVLNILELKGNFDQDGEPVHDDFYENALKILDIF